MRSLRAALLALPLVFGCSVGTTSSNYQPAKGPAGAAIALELEEGRKLHGELLAVESDRILMLEGRRLVRVAMRSLKMTKAPKVTHRGSGFSAAARERLRLISRYPQGVSAELERSLLEAYGQSAVVEVP